MVLGRHMEAMAKALSRPDSRQEGEAKGQPGSPRDDRAPADRLGEERLAQEGNPPLPADVELLPTGVEKVPSHLFDAPTVADPLAEAREGAEAGVSSHAASSTASSTRVTAPGNRRFTTIDQEQARRPAQPAGNLLPLVAQLLGILAALGLLVWGGWWLMRPATADDLYAQIMGVVQEKGTENLRVIEKPLREFYQRFAGDPRTVELDKFREELELQQMERKLRRNVKMGGASQVSPIGQLYGMAIAMASSDPQRGVEMLSSLLALYDPEGESAPVRTLPKKASTSLDESGKLFSPSQEQEVAFRERASLSEEEGLSVEDRRWLVIARRQRAGLLDRGREQRANLSDSLNERLRVALKLRQTRPEVATRMFQAIVDLYSGQAWAAEIVAEARHHLKLANPTKELP
jgi:hypothetical protein